MLPLPGQGDGAADFLTAAFTSTSAICVTGLIVVDTPSYWSLFGEVVIMGLIQIGGIGIMTLASLVAVFVVRRLGLRGRVLARAERDTVGLGDVAGWSLGVARSSSPSKRLRAGLRAPLWPGIRLSAASAALPRRLPFGLGVQQRRLRALDDNLTAS